MVDLVINNTYCIIHLISIFTPQGRYIMWLGRNTYNLKAKVY